MAGDRRVGWGPVVALALVVAAGAGVVLLSSGGQSRSDVVVRRVPDAAAGGPSAVGVGPSLLVRGVPVGWSHDRGGAEAAAVSAVGLSGAVAGSGPLARRDMVMVLATAAFGPRLADEVDRQLDGLPLGTGGRVADLSGLTWQEHPLAHQSEPLGGDGWRVRVWSALVLVTAPGLTPRQVWRTNTLGLVWEAGDWKVDRWEVAAGPTPLPTPALGPPSPVPAAEAARWAPVVSRGGS